MVVEEPGFEQDPLVGPRTERIGGGGGVLHARLIVGFHAGGDAGTGFAAVVHVIVDAIALEHPCRLEEPLGTVRV